MDKNEVFEEWMAADENFSQLAVRYLKHDKVISDEEYESLHKMLDSPDKENHVLAKEIINIKDKTLTEKYVKYDNRY